MLLGADPPAMSLVAAASRWVPIFSRAGARMLYPAARRAMVRYGPTAAAALTAGARVARAAPQRAGQKRKYKGVKKSSKKLKRGSYTRFPVMSRMSGVVRRGTRKQANAFAKYSSRGTVSTHQVSGFVSDPDCVYLTAASIAPDTHIYDICQVIARKLLSKANIYPTDTESTLPLGSPQFATGSANASLGKYTWGIYDYQGTSISTGSISTTTSLEGFAAALQPALVSYASGATNSSSTNVMVPHTVMLFHTSYETSGGVELPIVETISTLYLENEYISILSEVNIKLQNRTLSDDNSTSDTDITKNPIEGYVYEMMGCPKPKLDYLKLLKSVNVSNGMNLIRAAQVYATYPVNAIKEPPLPKAFSNCYRARKLYINPGGIKTVRFYFTKKMGLLNWLKDVRDQYDATPNGVTVPAPHRLIALKDVINVSTGNNVNVAYEMNRRTGIMLTTGRNHTIGGDVILTTYSNVP